MLFLRSMEPSSPIVLRYRGRAVTGSDIQFIRDLIATHPGLSRRRLSEVLCEAWGWRQPNGSLRDMVCRGLMLALHRAAHIELPPLKKHPLNPLATRTRPLPIAVDQTQLTASLQELGHLDIRQVRRTAEEGCFNALLQAHHYLGYKQAVGEHLKFMVYAGARPVALFAWSSAPRHLGPRDRFVGWSKELRQRNLQLIAYNTRFLILPWVAVPHLASHLISRMTRILPEQWRAVYGHPVYFAETFVDTTRYRGTCYRAANWRFLGRTQGRGKDDQTHKPNRSLKDVWGMPLVNDFRERLLAA